MSPSTQSFTELNTILVHKLNPFFTNHVFLMRQVYYGARLLLYNYTFKNVYIITAVLHSKLGNNKARQYIFNVVRFTYTDGAHHQCS